MSAGCIMHAGLALCLSLPLPMGSSSDECLVKYRVVEAANQFAAEEGEKYPDLVAHFLEDAMTEMQIACGG